MLMRVSKRLIRLMALSLWGSSASAAVSGEVVRGVNLGGWLVLEPWITPSLFTQFLNAPRPAVDEYTFNEVLGPTEAHRQLLRHWETWVTYTDLAQLKQAGITHIRFPVGYWAVDKRDGEPWTQGALAYLRKGVSWAHDLNLKVVIDIHGAPGSQNGFDNSGRYGPINFFHDQDNLDRMYRVLSNLTQEFIHYGPTLAGVQLVNEPAGWALNRDKLNEFYDQGYHAVRQVSQDVPVMVHDAFLSPAAWAHLPQRMQNIHLDTHIYQVFDDSLVHLPKADHLNLPCHRWDELAASRRRLPTVVGEFSLATTDCTKWLNGFNKGSRLQGDLNNPPPRNPLAPKCRANRCLKHNHLALYDAEHRAFLKQFANQQIRVYETAGSGWYFWNFKAENSPEWDFLLVVREGWINLNAITRSTCSQDT